MPMAQLILVAVSGSSIANTAARRFTLDYLSAEPVLSTLLSNLVKERRVPSYSISFVVAERGRERRTRAHRHHCRHNRRYRKHHNYAPQRTARHRLLLLSHHHYLLLVEGTG
jgi:hypothetical protein